MNSIAKGTNSIGKPTNSLANLIETGQVLLQKWETNDNTVVKATMMEVGLCDNKISHISIMLLIITIISIAIYVDHKHQYKNVSSL